MASYHFHAKALQRSAGQGAVFTAAYNAREQLRDDREDRLTRDYGHGGRETMFSGIFAPKDAPAWAHDREQLWNHAEAAERRKDAQPARNLDFALPHELTDEQREWLVKDYVRETFVRRGMIADVNIHGPDKEGDPRNFHVHCLLTMRRLEGDQFAPTKEREWNSKAELAAWKEKLAEMGCKALHRAGHHIEAERWRHGHKTLAEQREAALARGDADHAARCLAEASRHLGPTATAMQRKGKETDRGQEEPRDSIEEIDLEGGIARDESELAMLLAMTQQPQRQQRQDGPLGPEPPPFEPEAARAGATPQPPPKPKERPQPEPPKQEPKREPEARPQPPKHERPATKMEARINELRAQAMTPGAFAAALYREGITIARTDQRGADMLDRERADAIREERQSFAPRVREGELVAVNPFGGVHRLNPHRVDLPGIEGDLTTGTKNHLPSLSDARAWTLAQRATEKAERDAKLAAQAEARRTIEAKQQAEWQKQQRHGAGLTGALREFVESDSGRPRQAATPEPVKSAARAVGGGLRVASSAGNAATGLVDFVAGLFGGGTPPQTAQSPADKIKQQRRAVAALESIAESLARGDDLSPQDVANLTPTNLTQIRDKGDDYMRQICDRITRDRAREREERER